jgi:hypothetical protein
MYCTVSVYVLLTKQNKRPSNTQTNKQLNKQIIKQPQKTINQTIKQTNKQTNKPTNKQTNKQTINEQPRNPTIKHAITVIFTCSGKSRWSFAQRNKETNKTHKQNKLTSTQASKQKQEQEQVTLALMQLVATSACRFMYKLPTAFRTWCCNGGERHNQRHASNFARLLEVRRRGAQPVRRTVQAEHRRQFLKHSGSECTLPALAKP